jgi:hypothetical protein
LQLALGGQTIDVTGPNGYYRNLPCLVASEDWAANAVEGDRIFRFWDRWRCQGP